MAPFRIVFAAGTYRNLEFERELCDPERYELSLDDLSTPERIAVATAAADAVVVTTNPLPDAAIAALGPRVRVIGRAGIGLDAIALEAAADRGIAVVNTPDYATEEVAGHAAALALAVRRRLLLADQLARGDWGARERLDPLSALADQVLGILGFGRIGRRVHELLAPLFGAVLVHDPLVADMAETVTASSFDELVAGSDVLTLHLPLNDVTRHIIGAGELARMRPGAAIVNVSRGGLLDQAALAAALHRGVLGGAGLDVLEREPPAPDDPILTAPNTIITPHVAWYSAASERRMRELALAAVRAQLEQM